MDARPIGTLLGVGLALTLVGAACGSDSDKKDTGGAATTVVPPTSTASKTLAVTGTDYAFTGVPETVSTGTVVSFKNASTKEVHELVALRVKDGDTRPVGAILKLPEAERDQATEFRGVLIAYPGEQGFAPQGPLTLSQPGRYLLVCTIPTGADPAAYRENAKTAKGPVVVPGGAPHVAAGMFAELKVT